MHWSECQQDLHVRALRDLLDVLYFECGHYPILNQVS